MELGQDSYGGCFIAARNGNEHIAYFFFGCHLIDTPGVGDNDLHAIGHDHSRDTLAVTTYKTPYGASFLRPNRLVLRALGAFKDIGHLSETSQSPVPSKAETVGIEIELLRKCIREGSLLNRLYRQHDVVHRLSSENDFVSCQRAITRDEGATQSLAAFTLNRRLQIKFYLAELYPLLLLIGTLAGAAQTAAHQQGDGWD